MSSRVQSREIRYSSQRAPPLIMSFAFTSGEMERPLKIRENIQISAKMEWSDMFGIYFSVPNFVKPLPCCARWQSASSTCRLISEASLLAFCTIHGSAPSSIRRDRPSFMPTRIETYEQTILFNIHFSHCIILAVLILYLKEYDKRIFTGSQFRN